MDDIKYYDLAIYKSLKNIIDTDLADPDILMINFAVQLTDSAGKVIKEAELIKDGNNVYVYNANKQ